MAGEAPTTLALRERREQRPPRGQFPGSSAGPGGRHHPGLGAATLGTGTPGLPLAPARMRPHAARAVVSGSLCRMLSLRQGWFGGLATPPQPCRRAVDAAATPGRTNPRVFRGPGGRHLQARGGHPRDWNPRLSAFRGTGTEAPGPSCSRTAILGTGTPDVPWAWVPTTPRLQLSSPPLQQGEVLRLRNCSSRT